MAKGVGRSICKKTCDHFSWEYGCLILECNPAGGGAALLHLAEFVPEFIDSLQDAEEKLGAEIVRKALVCPARLIASNAGYEGDVIIESLKNTPFETGYNAVSPYVCHGNHHSIILTPVISLMSLERFKPLHA